MREADFVERFDVPSIRRELEISNDGGWDRRGQSVSVSLSEKCWTRQEGFLPLRTSAQWTRSWCLRAPMRGSRRSRLY